MTNHEAKFILRSFRADGSDASDPTFRDALARADRDPGLRAWLEHERELDRALRELNLQPAGPKLSRSLFDNQK